MRKVMRIEVGTHRGMVGYTQQFETGEIEHQLFSLVVAKTLVQALSQAIDEVEIAYKTADSVMTDSLKVQDVARVKIKDPKKERENGEG